MPALTFSRLWDELLAEGVVTITAPALAERAGATLQTTYWAAHEAKARRRLFSPAKGLYVLVPPQYRAWGVVPADWFVDDLMLHLGLPYYVGFLTAAARHGASHQPSQLFQVVTGGRVKDRDIGGIQLRFYGASCVEERPVARVTGPTGRYTVATPETCVLDMAERPEDGGGISTMLDVLAELSVDGELLAQGARTRARAVARRCGWVLSRVNPRLDLRALRVVAAPEEGGATLLVPGGARRGPRDAEWGIVVNTMLEAAG